MEEVIHNKCIALTQLGVRCKTNALVGGILCYRHKIFHNGGKVILTIYDDVNLPGQINNSDDDIDSGSDSSSNNDSDSNVSDQKEVNDFFVMPFIFDGDFPCRCCGIVLPFDNLIKCTGSSEIHKHAFCKECVSGYIMSGLDDRKAQIKCIMASEGCNGTHRNSDIKLSLPEKVYSNYEDIASINDALQFCKIFDNYTLCPFCCKYGCIADQEVQYVKCGRCEKKWCIKCRREQHDEDPCGKIKDSKDLAGIKQIINETITEALTHKCPNCGVKYIKENGCNMMTCTSCGANSCYICGIFLPERIIDDRIIKYYHFKGAGSADATAKCLLWNDGTGKTSDHGNAIYNNIKLTEKCQELVNINDNVTVKKIIHKELRKMGINVVLPQELRNVCTFL